MLNSSSNLIKITPDKVLEITKIYELFIIKTSDISLNSFYSYKMVVYIWDKLINVSMSKL